jgi:transposase-like protein
MAKSVKNLEIRQRRIFSEAFKKQQVELLIAKKITPTGLKELYGISLQTVYRWLYRYSPHYKKGTVQVVQMESEAEKTKKLQEKLAAVERTVGQKQMYIDYLEQLITLASEELKVDIKKNFTTLPSNGSASTEENTLMK